MTTPNRSGNRPEAIDEESDQASASSSVTVARVSRHQVAEQRVVLRLHVGRLYGDIIEVAG